jgi:hypothetical protein
MFRCVGLALVVIGSLLSVWALGRLTAQGLPTTPPPASASVTPVAVREGWPWTSTDTHGVTSWCVSNGDAQSWPPITQPPP